MNKLSKKMAESVYDILVEECGAPEANRHHFVVVQTREMVREWRFSGNLGFGGKFRRRRYLLPEQQEFYVDCYQEDETDERKAAIAAANRRLKELEN